MRAPFHALFTLTSCAALFFVGSARAETFYNVVAFSSGNAFDISENGIVAGQATTAFLYNRTAGTYTNLGALGGDYTFSRAEGVNDSGQAVGVSYQANLPGITRRDQAFIYSNGTMTGLGYFGGYETKARGINNSGQVIVNVDEGSSNHTWRAFLVDGSSRTDIGSLGRGYTAARAINDAGDIVGTSYSNINPQHAFLYRNGSMRDIDTLNSVYSIALDISESGTIVGERYTDALDRHAFVYTESDGMRDLGTLGGKNSFAYGVNSSGDVVGMSETSMASGGTSAFFYRNGVMSKLDRMLDYASASSGWWINDVGGINDSGQIVGNACRSGGCYAVLLNPVDAYRPPPPPVIDPPPITGAIPEPETYAMLLAGLGLLGLTARRRRQKLNA